MTTTITLSNLATGYITKKGPRTVAQGLNATITGGELTCLLGPNGAGKSTLLRTLAGFQPPVAGTATIAGRDITALKPADMARLVAIVLTEKPDTGNMTVRELVELGRSPYTGFWGRCSPADRDAAQQAMQCVGIDPLAGRRVATLSDGERQKVLDFASKVETMRMLHGIARQTGKVVFMSTHDLDLALQAADTLWLMKPGGEVATGSPEDLALDGRLAAFFDSPAMRFEPATGLFAVRPAETETVNVTGEQGPRRAMLCKALLRNGMAAGQAAADISVEVGREGFTVRREGSEAHTTTIAEAMRKVMEMKSEK